MTLFLLITSLLTPMAHADRCPGFQNAEEERQLLDAGSEASYEHIWKKFRAQGFKVKQLMLSEESAWLGALGDCGAKNYSTNFEVVYETESQACIVRGVASYFGRFNELPTVSVVAGSESQPDCIDLSRLKR